MLIDTNGFEIGDEVYIVKVFGNGKGKTILCHEKDFIYGFHYYDSKHKLYIDTQDSGMYAIKYCFHTEQQAIDYCNHMNGEE